jgi:hypothetical protein
MLRFETLIKKFENDFFLLKHLKKLFLAGILEIFN